MKEAPSLLTIPVELRVRIYDDMIEDCLSQLLPSPCLTTLPPISRLEPWLSLIRTHPLIHRELHPHLINNYSTRITIATHNTGFTGLMRKLYTCPSSIFLNANFTLRLPTNDTEICPKTQQTRKPC